jgi:hypothetical protein
MKIKEIIKLLDAKVHYLPDNFDREIEFVGACDLMSDVLALTDKHRILLITGLITPQVIRTASLLDLPGVIIARAKEPKQETIELAKDVEIPLMSTKYTLFTSSGLLYMAGLRGIDLDLKE